MKAPTTRWKVLLVGLLSLAWAQGGAASAAAPSAVQRPKDKSAAATLVLFAGSLKQARALAAERNVPIVAVPLLDDEPDNVAARNALLASAEFATLSTHCVLFFSNRGQHPLQEITETVDGSARTRSICSLFRTATCKEHQQHWDEIYSEYNEDGELRCPQVLLLEPDGKLAQRLSAGHQPEVSAMQSALAQLQTRLGRGLSDAELVQLKDALARAVRAETAGKSGSAWRAFAEALVLCPDGARGEQAKAGQQRAMAQLATLRAGAEAKLDGDARLGGYLELEALASDWQDTAAGAELTRTLRRAEKEPLLREALLRKKLEDEAQKLWDEAAIHLKAQQPKEAERKLRILLRKYGGTQAWERAAKAYPEWVPVKGA